MAKSYVHPRNLFRLTLPDDWECGPQKSNVAFYEPINGVGALQISTFVPPRDATVDPKEIATEFIPARLRNSVMFTEVSPKTSNTGGAYGEYQDGERAWRLWVLRGNSRVAIVTYISKRDTASEERSVVDKIVGSIILGE